MDVRRMLFLAFLLCWSIYAVPCTLARGYFYQVTELKGKVVGRSLGPVQFQWLRRMFTVRDAELLLYPYEAFHPDHPPIAWTRTNAAGEFAFNEIKQGHYTLQVKVGSLYDLFDVEITNKVRETKRITIDVSPIRPDCTGGHQFDVEAQRR